MGQNAPGRLEKKYRKRGDPREKSCCYQARYRQKRGYSCEVYDYQFAADLEGKAYGRMKIFSRQGGPWDVRRAPYPIAEPHWAIRRKKEA